MSAFCLSPLGPYSLAASARFLCGFMPVAGGATSDADRLTLAFLSDRDFAPVVASLTTKDDGAIACDVAGASGDGVAAQVARILSLDHDARGLAAVARRDGVVAHLLSTRPGFRPVCFPSPYEAAVWGILAQRISMDAAASMKRRLALATGSMVDAFDQRFVLTPSPARLLEVESFPGLPKEKLLRLHGVARAAQAGTLDAARLRAMTLAEARDALEHLRGVGPWTREHILVRGCGTVDELPAHEPRVHRAVAEAYQLGVAVSSAELARISDAWRPYRTWIAVLLVAHLHAKPGWARARARAKHLPLGSARHAVSH
jgi:DNA-3-methyladenine glycosylase II